MSRADRNRERFDARYRDQQRNQAPRKQKKMANGNLFSRAILENIWGNQVIGKFQEGAVFYAAPPRPMNKEQELEQRLGEARRQLEEQNEFLKQVTDPGFASGVVVTAKGGKGSVAIGQALTYCNIPDGARPGDTVRVVAKSGQPFDVVKEDRPVGDVCTVESISGDLLVVTVGSGTRAIRSGGLACKPGDRVIVERSFHVATQNLGPEERSFILSESTNVSWDDIGGLEDAKDALREAIEFPTTHRGIYDHYQSAPSRGVLLYGPPGCGKTMLGKAAATSLQASSGDGGGFIYVKGPEVLSMWVGAAENTVRSLFRQAREYKARTGTPAILFIDEAEALLASRSVDGFRGGIQATLVPAFLAEMDGLTESGAFVILATNRQGQLDAAITRDGRIDRKVHVSRPGKAQSRRIFELACRGIPVSEPIHDLLCDEVFAARDVIAATQFDQIKVELRLPDIMSGSLAAGIVRRAAELAMRRDRQSGEMTGVTLDDAKEAVRLKAAEQIHLNWTADLIDKAREVLGAEVVHQVARQHSGAN
jgi:proteasome-associated ATPase